MTLFNKTEYSYLEDIKLSKELVSKFKKEIITILKDFELYILLNQQNSTLTKLIQLLDLIFVGNELRPEKSASWAPWEKSSSRWVRLGQRWASSCSTCTHRG